MGFGATPTKVKTEDKHKLLSQVEADDLLKFGFIPEFIGRMPVLAILDDLDEKSLVDIMTKPRNALVKQYQRLFELEKVKLSFTPGALEAVARESMRRKSGARGLRAILEDVMLDIMYEVPSQSEIREVVVNEEVILRRAQPLRVYDAKVENG
jgi:ATP-dependent Clp protease ATP-binding subunit ClpX